MIEGETITVGDTSGEIIALNARGSVTVRLNNGCVVVVMPADVRPPPPPAAAEPESENDHA